MLLGLFTQEATKIIPWPIYCPFRSRVVSSQVHLHVLLSSAVTVLALCCCLMEVPSKAVPSEFCKQQLREPRLTTVSAVTFHFWSVL